MQMLRTLMSYFILSLKDKFFFLWGVSSNHPYYKNLDVFSSMVNNGTRESAQLTFLGMGPDPKDLEFQVILEDETLILISHDIYHLSSMAFHSTSLKMLDVRHFSCTTTWLHTLILTTDSSTVNNHWWPQHKQKIFIPKTDIPTF